jgi:hypothetical protein
MLGAWQGTVHQGSVTFSVAVTLRGGAMNSTVGTERTSEGCVSDLVLRGTGLSSISVQEELTEANQRCTGAFRVLLTLNSDGTLGYFYDATLLTDAGLATLTRVAPTPS